MCVLKIDTFDSRAEHWYLFLHTHVDSQLTFWGQFTLAPSYFTLALYSLTRELASFFPLLIILIFFLSFFFLR